MNNACFSDSRDQQIRRWRRFDPLRITLALILLAAAGLKGYELTTGSGEGAGLLASRWLLVAVVELELLLGLWLLSGLYPRRAWAASIACFAIFECFSFSLAVLGRESCGCFGAVHVNPWLMCGLDGAALAALAWRGFRSVGFGADDGTMFAPGRGVAMLALVWILVGLPLGAGAAFRSVSASPSPHAGDAAGPRNDDIGSVDAFTLHGFRATASGI